MLLRSLIGEVLRRTRQRQGRTLREVSAAARVSLGYLSEVERGQKEASSELLAAIASALGVPLARIVREASELLAAADAPAPQIGFHPSLPAALPRLASSLVPAGADAPEQVPATMGAAPTRFAPVSPTAPGGGGTATVTVARSTGFAPAAASRPAADQPGAVAERTGTGSGGSAGSRPESLGCGPEGAPVIGSGPATGSPESVLILAGTGPNCGHGEAHLTSPGFHVVGSGAEHRAATSAPQGAACARGRASVAA